MKKSYAAQTSLLQTTTYRARQSQTDIADERDFERVPKDWVEEGEEEVGTGMASGTSAYTRSDLMGDRASSHHINVCFFGPLRHQFQLAAFLQNHSI